MFLRNFDNWLVALMGFCEGAYSSDIPKATSAQRYCSYGDTYSTEFKDGNINLKLPNTTLTQVCCCYAYNSAGSCAKPAAFGPGNVCLFDGDTAVTYEDFKMSGSNQLSASDKLAFDSWSQTQTFESASHRFKKEAVLTVRNADLVNSYTVKEWGLWSNLSGTYGATYGSYNNSGSDCALYFREVLASPVTVPAGGTAVLTLTAYYPMIYHA